jgi:hypothetical protein
VELEFGAITERLEPENLKPLQFEQRELLRNSGQLSVASCQSLDPLRSATAWPWVFTKGIPPPEFDAGWTTSWRHCSPLAGWASTKLSYCNGEIGAGSSNITPYMVWACEGPLWVAQTLRQMNGFTVEMGRRWEEPREQNNARAG